jgi:quercetin dioxygenase-like cupin family protein
MSVSIVHFHDGARTYVHSHKGGQILLILRGTAQVGTVADDMIEELAPGDMVHAAAGERHWHGAAAPGIDMSHLSIAIGPSTWEGPPPMPLA